MGIAFLSQNSQLMEKATDQELPTVKEPKTSVT